MKKLLSILCVVAFCFTAVAQLGPTNAQPRVLLSWDPNPEPDIGGYKIYYGTNSRVYDVVIDVGNVTNAITSNFVRGVIYYFAATAYNTVPLESDFSDEVSLFIQMAPVPPEGLRTTNAPVVDVAASLQRSISPTGPWQAAALYPTNSFTATDAQFFRVVMGIDFPQ